MKKKTATPHFLFGAPLHGEVVPTLQWVEVASSFQIPSFQIIGLPSPEVAEARDRIRSAVESIGEEFPKRRVVLNLSPARVRKHGTGSDLAMALAILATDHRGSPVKGDGKSDGNKQGRKPEIVSVPSSPASASVRVVAWGELGLDGRVKAMGQPIRTLYACWANETDYLLIAREDYDSAVVALGKIAEAQSCNGKAPIVIPVGDLREAWDLIRSERYRDYGNPEPQTSSTPLARPKSAAGLLPLAPSLERVIAVAALGSHHVLLLGPKGTGKSHALEWLVALQDDIPKEIQIKTALLEELRESQDLSMQKSAPVTSVPIRRVGPQVKAGALVGSISGGLVHAGEFSLADGGLLLADELPEWSRDAREALREPLERGSVSLNRVRGSIEMPARFTLAANGNLCPCGGVPDSLRVQEHQSGFAPSKCRCPERLRKIYLARLSGPVLDRIDLTFMSNAQPPLAMSVGEGDPHILEALKERVAHARARSRSLWGSLTGALSSEALEKLLFAHPGWKIELDRSPVTSLRGRHKVLRVALSLAVWDGQAEPGPAHFFEAFCYRPEHYGLT